MGYYLMCCHSACDHSEPKKKKYPKGSAGEAIQRAKPVKITYKYEVYIPAPGPRYYGPC